MHIRKLPLAAVTSLPCCWQPAGKEVGGLVGGSWPFREPKPSCYTATLPLNLTRFFDTHSPQLLSNTSFPIARSPAKAGEVASSTAAAPAATAPFTRARTAATCIMCKHVAYLMNNKSRDSCQTMIC